MKIHILLVLVTLLISLFSYGNTEVLKKTKRVSLIFVGKTEGGFSESSFGHVALRLSQHENFTVTDATLEFVADIPEGEFSLKKYIRGAGIAPYKVAAKLLPYYEFKKIKRIEEDRDITLVDLNLTDEEVQKVTQYIINFQNNETLENYTFFYKNCSYFAIQAIEKAIGKKLPYKSLPWLTPGVLIGDGIGTAKHIISKASHERMRFADRAIKKNKLEDAFPKKSWINRFITNLGSESFYIRQNSYLKLLALNSHNKTSDKTNKEIRSLVRYLKTAETEGNKFAINNLFSNPQYKKVIELAPIKYNLSMPKDKSKIKHKLVLKDNLVQIQLEWKKRVRRANSKTRRYVTVKKLVPIKELEYTPETYAITFNGMQMGTYLKHKKLDFVLSQRLDYGIDIDVESKTIHTLVYLDSSDKVKSPQLNYETLKAKGILAVNNNKDFQGSGGTCYAMAMLQKALIERVTFLPEKAQNSTLNKLELLRRVYKGEYAIIPGHKNINDFTASIEKEELKTFIITVQNDLNLNPAVQLYQNLRYQGVLDSNSLPKLKAMLTEGVIVPLTIGRMVKGTNKLDSNVGHIILVFDINKQDDGTHRLTTYDPNTGLHTLYVLDNNFKLQFPYFNSDFDFIGDIKFMEQAQIEIDHAVRSREFRLDELDLRSKDDNTIVLGPGHILTILK